LEAGSVPGTGCRHGWLRLGEARSLCRYVRHRGFHSCASDFGAAGSEHLASDDPRLGAEPFSHDPCRSRQSQMKFKPKTTNTSLQTKPGGVHGIERRVFLKQSLSLGALALLGGCDATDEDATQKF